MMAGCQPKSEVDKCVKSLMKRDEPYSSEKDRNENEALYRVGCLKAQAGK